MLYAEVQPIALAIMTSIITGGFVLVFVEIGNRRNRENDRHDGIMSPFIHKLSAFFRFINWCRGRVVYPAEMNGNERAFKKLINEMSQYGSQLVIHGGDFLIDSFSANQLHDIAFDINNIWYYHDKMRPSRLEWESREFYDEQDLIAKELKEINPRYLSLTQNAGLIAKVSGDFYVDVYQHVEYETYRHESYMRLYKAQTIWVSAFFSFVLLMLCLMLFTRMPVLFIQLASICVVLMLIASLLFLAIDVKCFIEWKEGQKEKRRFRKEANRFKGGKKTK